MDEAHKQFLGKSAHVEIFVEQTYRRFRKLWCFNAAWYSRF